MESTGNVISSDGRTSGSNPFSSPQNAPPNPISLLSTARVTALASDASSHNPFELFSGDQKRNSSPITENHSSPFSMRHSRDPESQLPESTVDSFEAMLMTQKLRTALRVSLQAFAQQNASISFLRESERKLKDRLDELYEFLAVAGSRNRVLEGEVHMLRQLNLRTICCETPRHALQGSICGAFPKLPSDIEDSRRDLSATGTRCHDCVIQLRALKRALAESENENIVLKGQLRRQREVIEAILGLLSEEGLVEKPPVQCLEDSINQLHDRLTRTLGNETTVSSAPLDDPNWKWETGLDKNSGRIFWINHVDQTTQWEPPPYWANLPLPPLD